MKLLYLDIDGVLNNHQHHGNGYCGIEPACVARLNRVLAEFRDLRLVISSAWRYLVLGEAMTLKGFEALLLTHGLNCHERLAGVTARDEDFLPANPAAEDYQREGLRVRAAQIEAHRQEQEPAAWCVLDDMAVPVARLVQTDGGQGLQTAQVREVLAWLREQG